MGRSCLERRRQCRLARSAMAKEPKGFSVSDVLGNKLRSASGSQTNVAKAVTLTASGNRRIDFSDRAVPHTGFVDKKTGKVLDLTHLNPETVGVKDIFPQRFRIFHGLGEDEKYESGTAGKGFALNAQAKDILWTVFQNLKRIKGKNGRQLSAFVEENYLHDIVWECTGYSRQTFDNLSKEVARACGWYAQDQ